MSECAWREVLLEIFHLAGSKIFSVHLSRWGMLLHVAALSNGKQPHCDHRSMTIWTSNFSKLQNYSWLNQLQSRLHFSCRAHRLEHEFTENQNYWETARTGSEGKKLHEGFWGDGWQLWLDEDFCQMSKVWFTDPSANCQSSVFYSHLHISSVFLGKVRYVHIISPKIF